MKKINKRIGILGGTFDPAHKGHLYISKEAQKLFNLREVIWAITKKNPFKSDANKSLNTRIKFAKQLSINYKFIKVRFFEKKVKSTKTIKLINYIKKKNFDSEIFFLMGADNLINFHKWKSYLQISKKCKILVFDRNRYKQKSLNSIAYKKLHKKALKFIYTKKVNISSSQIRKI